MTIENQSEVLLPVWDPEGSAPSLSLLMKFENESVDVGGRKCVKKLKIER